MEKDRWKKWKKGRKIHDEKFPDNFQAAFTSQLVEIGMGFIDCKIFFVLYWIEHFQLKVGEILYYRKVFSRTIAIAYALKGSAFEEFCFAEFYKDHRAQSNFRFCF